MDGLRLRPWWWLVAGGVAVVGAGVLTLLSIKGNWEGTSPVGPPIEFVPLEEDRVDKLLASRGLVLMSAYSLDRARQAMRNVGPAATR
jgi:hypothetical protein